MMLSSLTPPFHLVWYEVVRGESRTAQPHSIQFSFSSARLTVVLSSHHSTTLQLLGTVDEFVFLSISDHKSLTPPRMADRNGHLTSRGFEPNLWEFLSVCQPTAVNVPTTSGDPTLFRGNLPATFTSPIRTESATPAPPPLPARRAQRSTIVGPPVCRPSPASPSFSLPVDRTSVLDSIPTRRSLNELISRDHYELDRPTSQPDSSEEIDSELIRLDNPRPGILRNSNDYVDTTKHLQQQKEFARGGPNPLLPARTPSRGPGKASTSGQKHHRTEAILVKERPSGHHQSHLVRKSSSHRHHHRPTSPGPILLEPLGPGRPQNVPNCRTRDEFVPTKLSAFAPVVTSQPRRTVTSNFPEKLDAQFDHKSGLHARDLDLDSSPSASCFERCAQSRSSGTKCGSIPNDQTSHICRECGRCRCSACTTPRPLPSCWTCDNSCLISADSIVDCLSCLCCVRGCQYHLQSGKERSEPLPDSVVSCAESGRCARWSCLGAAALLLPCIWCWWPLKGLQKLVECGYAKCCDRGCRCQRGWGQSGAVGQLPPMPPSKATLSSSTPGSQSRKQLLVAEDKASGRAVVHPLKLVSTKDPT